MCYAGPTEGNMKKAIGLVMLLWVAGATPQAGAQPANSGVEKLYILNCGEGVPVTFRAGRPA